MANLDWLEWNCIPDSLNFKVTQHGSFPSCIEKVELSRGSYLKLLALGKGNGDFDFSQDYRIKNLFHSVHIHQFISLSILRL